MSVVALLLGSSRANANGPGLSAWLQGLFAAEIERAGGNIPRLHVVDPHTAPHPLGPVLDPIMAAKIRNPDQYASPAVREWSRFVSSCSGFVILTPQYNWGYPGELKNALDHLYHEWGGKPVSLVTYGGHGGGKCAAQLTEVLEGGLKMRVVAQAGVTLPGEYIRGDLRVPVGGEDAPPFLQQYEAEVAKALQALLEALPRPPDS